MLGNCYIHCLQDQLLDDQFFSNIVSCPIKLRKMVVDSLDLMIASRRIEYIADDHLGSKEDWVLAMSTDRTFVDQLFIQLSAEVLNRPIILYPVLQKDGHFDSGRIVINPKNPIEGMEPIYMLYYSETSFHCGHFQSIRPRGVMINSTRLSELEQPQQQQQPQEPQEPQQSQQQQASKDMFDSESHIEMPEASASVANSTQMSQRSKKSREASYMDQSNILPSSKRRRQ